MSAEPITITTTPEQAVDFLRKLASDEEFRKRYAEDTTGLLAEYGVQVPAGLIPKSLEPPPAETLAPLVASLELALGGDEAQFGFIWGFVFFSFLGPMSFRGHSQSGE